MVRLLALLQPKWRSPGQTVSLSLDIGRIIDLPFASDFSGDIAAWCQGIEDIVKFWLLQQSLHLRDKNKTKLFAKRDSFVVNAFRTCNVDWVEKYGNTESYGEQYRITWKFCCASWHFILCEGKCSAVKIKDYFSNFTINTSWGEKIEPFLLLSLLGDNEISRRKCRYLITNSKYIVHPFWYS